MSEKSVSLVHTFNILLASSRQIACPMMRFQKAGIMGII